MEYTLSGQSHFSHSVWDFLMWLCDASSQLLFVDELCSISGRPQCSCRWTSGSASPGNNTQHAELLWAFLCVSFTDAASRWPYRVHSVSVTRLCLLPAHSPSEEGWASS